MLKIPNTPLYIERHTIIEILKEYLNKNGVYVNNSIYEVDGVLLKSTSDAYGKETCVVPLNVEEKFVNIFKAIRLLEKSL